MVWRNWSLSPKICLTFLPSWWSTLNPKSFSFAFFLLSSWPIMVPAFRASPFFPFTSKLQSHRDKMLEKISGITNSVYKNLNMALLLSYPPPSFQKRLGNTPNSCLSWRDCSALCQTARGMDTCEFGRKKEAGSLPGERLYTSRCRQRIWPCFKEEGHSSISSRDIVWATASEAKRFLSSDIQGQKPGARVSPGASWWNKHPPAVAK